MMRQLLVVFVLGLFTPLAFAADEPITPISFGKDDKLGVKAGGAAKPTKIESAKELEEAIPDEDTRKKFAKLVDFDKQVMLIFYWRGSGQDKLTYDVAESYPEQVFFQYKRGFTKDLRPHRYAFVLRKNVKWSVK